MSKYENEILVSIVIPTYNRIDILRKCLDSIVMSTWKNWECIVVDNASTDNTVEILEKNYSEEKRIKICRLSKNLMAAGGRNAGILKSNGQLILFLDSDNVIKNDMLEKMVDFYIVHPECGLLAPLSVNVHSSTVWLTSGTYNYYTSQPKTTGVALPFPNTDLEEYYETEYSPNAFMVKRDALEKVGGMDTFYYIMYEESDFGIRIVKAGYKNYLMRDAVTFHYGDIAPDEQEELRYLGLGTPERAFYFARNRSIFEKKYATLLQKIIFFTFVIHAVTIYYTYKALKNGRKDIAAQWIKGTLVGIRTKTVKSIYSDIDNEVKKYML